jgi:hypothetical protein
MPSAKLKLPEFKEDWDVVSPCVKLSKRLPEIFVSDAVDVYFFEVKLGFYTGGESEMIYLDICFSWDPGMIVEIQDGWYT